LKEKDTLEKKLSSTKENLDDAEIIIEKLEKENI